MRIKRELQVSKRTEREQGMSNRIKMDIMYAAAGEYYEKKKDDIVLNDITKDRNPHFRTYQFEVIILSDADAKEMIRKFRNRMIDTKGVGVEKADQATAILTELLVLND